MKDATSLTGRPKNYNNLTPADPNHVPLAQVSPEDADEKKEGDDA